jgi:hypothetical protein
MAVEWKMIPTVPVPITDGGSGQVTAQTAIDALTQVAGATNEYVLTKDTASGNALWKAGGAGSDSEKVKVDVAATADYLGAASNDGVLRTGTSLSYVDGGNFITLDTIQDIQTSAGPTFRDLTLTDGWSIHESLVGIDSYTKLLLHFDGADNSTVLVDNSFFNHAPTVAGDAQIDTAQSKFGGSSCVFDGTGDYISIPDHADWDFGSGDFTIDFWVYPTDTNRHAIIAGTSDYWLGIDYHYLGTRNINIWASSNGSSWNLLNADSGGNAIGAIILTLNTWTHVAIVRNGNNWRSYINGVKDIDVTVAGTLVTIAEAKSIGRWGGDAIPKWLGWIDEFRVSKGIARWTAAFTPPTTAYGDGIFGRVNASGLTLAIPLSIDNGGTGIATLTDHGLLLGSGTGAITPLGAATNGQIPIGSTGVDPVLAALTAGTGIGIANAAGSITVSSTITQYTDELAQDSVGGMIANTATINLTYTDLTPSLVADLNSTLKTNYDAAYTHSGLTTGNPHNVTKSDISLGSVENTALSTWAGTTNLTTLGTIATGVWNGTDVAIADGGTGQGTAQLAINALSAVSAATNEHVLTKDTATGNAIFKAATGGSDSEKVKVDAAATADYIGATSGAGVIRTNIGLTKTDGGDFITLSVAGTFVHRGDPSVTDWNETGSKAVLNTNGAWHDLDLSSIVPTGALAVLFSMTIKDDTADAMFALRKKGQTYTIITTKIRTQVANIEFNGLILCACDTNRVVEYVGDNLAFTQIALSVAGWWI